MEKKMTYVVAVSNAIEVVADEETRNRLIDLRTVLEKKAGSRKAKEMSETDKQNVESIKTLLADGARMTVSEIIKGANLVDDEGSAISTPKGVALLKKVGATTVKEGKKTLYGLE